jgi:hypothetical protein
MADFLVIQQLRSRHISALSQYSHQQLKMPAPEGIKGNEGVIALGLSVFGLILEIITLAVPYYHGYVLCSPLLQRIYGFVNGIS